MKSETCRCDDASLLRLLNVPEESDEYRHLSSHVQNCASCQTRIERLAAHDDDWAEAKEILAAASSVNGSRLARSSAPVPAWERRPTAWSEELAKRLLSPPSHPEMLGRLGRYEVERLIGSGGMGIVFKAFDTELNRPVAIKVLAPYLAGNGAARKRFAREARAAAAVVHDHVVPIHNVESDGEAPFLVMHYVAGESLQQRLDREGALDLCEILRIASQTASGLAAAHAQGLVHRDVKPSNILLEERIERALLTDFGLARAGDDASLTHSGYHPGTPQYMSPEQARGEAIDARSDLFSLGSVMYAMCTGRLPFRAETTFGILRRITDAEPRPIREINSAIPDWLAGVIGRLHSKSPDRRFATAGELHELLVGCLAHVQQPHLVPLPEGCGVGRRGNWRERVASPKGIGLIATVLVAATIAVMAVIPRTPRPTAADSQTSSAGPALASSSMSPPETGNDSAAGESETWAALEHPIQQSADEIDRLERAANTLWGDVLP